MSRKKNNIVPQMISKVLFNFFTVKKWDRETGKDAPYVEGEIEDWEKFEYEFEPLDDTCGAFTDTGQINIKAIFPYVQKVLLENPNYDRIDIDLDINADGEIGNPRLVGYRQETNEEVQERIKREEETETLKAQAKIQKEKDKEEKKRLKELELLEELKKKYNA